MTTENDLFPSNDSEEDLGTAVRPSLLRRMNQRRILEVVQTQGSMSRADLVRATGISAPTVSKLVQALLNAGFLEEGDAPEAVPGRPAKVLHLAKDGVRVLGAVLDIKECAIAAAGLDGQLSEERTVRFPTPESYEDLVSALATHARHLTSAGEQAPLALGVSVPGLVDRRQQQVLLSANMHLLDDRFLAADLQRQLDIPIVLLHDTDALCLGERTFGQARGMDDFVLIDATSGLGAAVMSGGQLLSGHSGLAGEVGHITVDPHGRRCGCGNIGCLETVASDWSVATLVSERLGRTLTIDQILAEVRAGTLQADAEIDRTIEYLAIGVAAVVNVFNPAAVLIEARMFDLRPRLFERLLELVRQRSLSPALADCKILRAAGSKLQSAVAGAVHHLTSVLGPKVQASVTVQ